MPAAVLFAAALAVLVGAPPPSYFFPVPLRAQTPAAPVSARVFGSPAGLVFNQIKADKVADFELVMARLRTALANNPDPVRKKQGAGWKVYKAAEPYEGSILYVFVIDPAVPGADYTISRILAQMYPAEVQDLYAKFRDAYASGPTMWEVTPVAPPAAARR